MEDQNHPSAPADTPSPSTIGDPSQPLDDASQPFVGRWNQLVSTTNWEKGQIIADWRAALIQAAAPATEYSDEAWARRVGSVTGQHIGRLRRVFDRFGETYTSYQGLYWSHFHAALDWDDAEMWLEGAVQSAWSVSQMRRQRWQAMGAVPADKPREAEVVTAGVDEDVDPTLDRDEPAARRTRDSGEPEGRPVPEGPDFGDEPSPSAPPRGDDGALIYAEDGTEASVQFVRPFENLAELPDDLAEAFEVFKLAILRHKAENWIHISRDDVLASLDALKELALAPALE